MKTCFVSLSNVSRAGIFAAAITLTTIVTITSNAAPILATKASTEKASQSEVSLKMMALNEVQALSGVSAGGKAIGTDTQLSGTLTLDDPKQEVLNRSFKFTMGLKVSNLSFKGQTENDVNEKFNLADSNNSFGPALDIGVHQALLQYDNVKWGLGVQLGAAYFNQSNPTTLQSGYKASDARLIAYQTYIHPYLTVRTKWAPRWAYEVGPHWTQTNLLQSSQSEYAKFNVRGNTSGLIQRIDYRINPQWSVLAELHQYSTTTTNQKSTLSIDDSTMLGVRSIW